MTAAELDGRTARISLRFVAELISCTRDKDGKVVEGDATEVQTIRDAWTFARDVELARSELEARRHRSGLSATPDRREPAWTEVAPSRAVRADELPRDDRFLRHRRLARRRSRRGACRVPRRRAADRRTRRRRRARSASTARPAARCARRARASRRSRADAARAFFEAAFRPAPDRGAGFVTGYYEPEVEASRVRDRALLACRSIGVPPIWSSVGDARPAGRLGSGDALRAADRDRPRALLRSRGDRGRARSPAAGWSSPSLEDPVDAFFIHVQGSARLQLAGRRARCGSPSTASPATPTPRSAGSRSSAAFFRARTPTRTGSRRG